MRNLMASSAAVCLLAVLLAAPGSAQTTITLEGAVLDEQGIPVENAQVTALGAATGESRSALTRANGEFRFLGLSPGRYTLTARLIGYRPVSEAVQLVVGQRARLTLAMPRETVELAPVEVRAERVRSVEVQRMSVSTPVLLEEIKNLPLNTRNAMSLAAITPGIRSYAPVQGRSLPSAGAVPDLRFINLQLDGVEMKSLFNGNLVGIPQTGSPLPADALQEFRVFVNPYDAEYSRAGAYVISALSRRGTNTFEGSAFGFFQNKDLVEKGAFQAVKPDFSRQQLGLNLRGPIRRDRLFFAASYELSRTNDFIDVVPGRPAINPDIWNQYAGTFQAPNRNHTGHLRLTYVPDARSTFDASWSARYMTGESFFGGTVAREGGIKQRYFINVAQLRHRYLPSASFVNEASLQLVSWAHSEPQLVPGPQLRYPSIRIGTAGFPLEIHETHWRLVNRATWSVADWHGPHIVKAGIELSRVSGDQYFPINRDGDFEFATDTSTLPLRASIGLGFVNPVGDADANSELSGWVTGVYVNDEWRPARSFALNLGLRFDAELNTLNNDFTVPWASDAELQALPQLRDFLNRGDRKNDLDNLSPRISFSWDVFDDNRTFLRGGFGIIYDRVPSFMGFQERRDATWRTYNFQNPGTTEPEVLRDRARSGAVTATPALTVVNEKMEAPENRQFSVGVGHQLTPSLGVNVDFIRQNIRHLYARLNLNYFIPSTGQRALTQRYGDIIVWDDIARARYTALLTALTYQRGDLRLNAAYTLSFAKTEYDGVTALAFPFRTSYVMQRMAGDERHRLVLSGIGTLPFGLTVSTITTLASPRPYSAILGQDANDNGFIDDDWIGGVRTREPESRWENWYRSVDVRLTQPVSLGSDRRLSIIAEAFNLFNWKNFSSFAGRQLNAAGQPLTTFGQPNGTFGTQQFQLGARAEF